MEKMARKPKETYGDCKVRFSFKKLQLICQKVRTDK